MSMTHAEILEVVQAAKERKPIQYRRCLPSPDEQGPWQDDDRTNPHRPDFNFYSYDYRIKPEPPMPREWWVVKRNGHTCFDDAFRFEPPGSVGIHVVEVLP